MTTVTNVSAYAIPWDTYNSAILTVTWDQSDDEAVTLTWKSGVTTVGTVYTTPKGGFPAGGQGKNFVYFSDMGLSSGNYTLYWTNPGGTVLHSGVVNIHH